MAQIEQNFIHLLSKLPKSD